MPIIKSAAKRMRQSVIRTRSNNRVRRQMRVQVKGLKSTIADGDHKSAATALPLAQASIDKAVKKGILHKNTAARRKSQLAKRYDQAFKGKGVARKPAANPPAKKKSSAKKPAKPKAATKQSAPKAKTKKSAPKKSA